MTSRGSGGGRWRQKTPRRSLLTVAVCLALGLLVLAIYYPVADFGFTNFDDDVYVRDNPCVRSGLSASNLWWALTTNHQSNWFPATWASFMLDAQVDKWLSEGQPDRDDAGIYHVTNVALHLANTLLLFAVLWRMTGSRWRSALVAALFAAHPLRVESVAWVVERKDVLSTLFWMACLWFYIGYARSSSRRSYAALVTAFVLGIMSKQMVVTLPIILLALDFWPLGRFADKGALRTLLKEKIPLFALAVLGAGAGYLAMNVLPRMHGSDFIPRIYPAGVGIATAIASYVFYLGKSFVPTGLAAYYPYPGRDLAAWVVPVAVAVIVVVTAVAITLRRSRPCVIVGWVWFVVALVPTVGIVASGQLAAADRFTYVPLTGLLIALVWLLPEPRTRIAGATTAVLAVGVVGALAVMSHVQVGCWRDSITLFNHAIAATRNNGTAHYNLGCALADRGDLPGAIENLEQAEAMSPHDARIPNRLGIILSTIGRHREAIAEIEKALRLNPRSPGTAGNLGVALMNAGRFDEAVEVFESVLKRWPNDPLARENLEIARQNLSGSQ
jgi:hypothetical protein